jgi:hypothetical protein
MKKYLILICFISNAIIHINASNNFCQFKRTIGQPSIPTIGEVNPTSLEHLKINQLIKTYAPIAYLHSKENNLPIRVEDYFTGSQTSLNAPDGKVIIPKEEVTMAKIYKLYKDKPDANNYFDIAKCVELGSNPVLNKNRSGVLNTPVYVLVFKQNNKLYVQYLFFYGFNAPYNIEAGTIEKIEKLPGGKKAGYNLREWFNAHEADLEHITLEFQNLESAPLRIYFGSHGRTEGMWLDWNSSEFQKEGTRPVIFIAKGGHGTYPKAGTYVRIFGFANDETQKGIRWEPDLVRIYQNTEAEFKPETMGWLYHAGNYGKHGVGRASGQSWFGNVSQDIGRPYNSVQLCPEPASYMCLLQKRLNARLPD